MTGLFCFYFFLIDKNVVITLVTVFFIRYDVRCNGGGKGVLIGCECVQYRELRVALDSSCIIYGFLH